MSFILMFLLMIFILAVLVTFVLHKMGHTWIAKILGGLLTGCITLFCGFGFLASFEPMADGSQYIWQIGYAALGLMFAGTTLFLLWPKRLLQ